MVEDQVRVFCAHLNISQAALAKAAGMSPQNLNNKLKNNSLTPDDLKHLAAVMGCQYVGVFVLPDGKKIEY